jgi:hypothetical protein
MSDGKLREEIRGALRRARRSLREGASTEEIQRAVIGALDAVIAPRSGAGEMLSDWLIRFIVAEVVSALHERDQEEA